MLIPWTYTLLKTFDNCAHQGQRRYWVKDVPYAETDAMKYGNQVHFAAEHRLKSNTAVPEAFHFLEPWCRSIARHKPIVEMKLGVTEQHQPCGFFAKDVWGRGKPDITIMNEETAAILDWKTGRVWEDPFQLEVEAFLLKTNFPKLKRITGNFIWLKENKLGEPHDLSDTIATWKTIRNLVNRIDFLEQNEKIWPKTQGVLCGWCNVIDCEHRKATA